MVRKGFLRFAFIAFLLLALLGMASTTVYRAGWSQGFVSGQVASDGDSEAAPAAPSGYTGRGFGYGFGFLAFCFKGFLMFFFLGILFKFFGFWAWRHGGRRKGWGHHWRKHHAHHGPRRGGRGPWQEQPQQGGPWQPPGHDAPPEKDVSDYV